MVEIMRRPRIIRETARGLETMSLEDDFFQKREIFLTTGIEAEVSTELIKQLLYLNSMLSTDASSRHSIISSSWT